MTWFRKSDTGPRIPQPRAGGEPSEADQAIQESSASKARTQDRWGHVHEATGFLVEQIETNHLAERLEHAMTLKGPRK